MTQDEIRTQITHGALTRLGVLAAGETPQSADAQLASDVLDRALDRLGADGNWFDGDSIPESAVLGLTTILCHHLAEAFGLPEGRADRFAAAAQAERHAMRTQGAESGGGTVPFSDY